MVLFYLTFIFWGNILYRVGKIWECFFFGHTTECFVTDIEADVRCVIRIHAYAWDSSGTNLSVRVRVGRIPL